MGRFSVISENAFNEFQAEVGVLLKNFNPESPELADADIICATTGGITHTCNAEYKDNGEDVDNCPNGMMELMEVTNWTATIAFNALNVTPEVIRMALGAAGVAVTSVSAALPPVVAVISIMVYSASFMFSWGPICWVLISEIFPNTIRGAAVAIAVAFQWIFNFIVSSTFLPMYNMSLGSMGENFGHAFTYGLYGVICVVAAVFVWKLVPETKGKTLEDMSKLWKREK